MRRTRCATVAFSLVVLVLGGCVGQPLMPTPNLYVDSTTNPFRDVPPELQSNTVDVLYLTDRQPETDSKGNLRYGYGRSYSLAWGIAAVALGRDASWPELVEASRSSNRIRQLNVEFVSVDERGRGPDTPIPFSIENGFARSDPGVVAEAQQVADAFHRELARRLALTQRKDVYFYIHGYGKTFEDTAIALSEVWHFSGRKGVPILYSWPSGAPGVLRGYVYDRESSEFTVHHLKRAIRIVSTWSEVEKIHVIAHSRGTDVAVSALRELFIEAWAKGISPRQAFRIENLVLVAPDLDTQVVDQRVFGEHLNAGVARLVAYTSPDDQAIGFAETLFASPRGRVGRFDVSGLTEGEMEIMGSDEWMETISVINFSGTSDVLGHSYFRTNPAVSSDVILLFEGHAPGSPARPLEPLGFGFWEVPKSYPNSQAE